MRGPKQPFPDPLRFRSYLPQASPLPQSHLWVCHCSTGPHNLTAPSFTSFKFLLRLYLMAEAFPAHPVKTTISPQPAPSPQHVSPRDSLQLRVNHPSPPPLPHSGKLDRGRDFHLLCPLRYLQNSNQRSNCQRSLDNRESKGIPENIYYCFINYAKAFDCVDQSKLFKILKRWKYQTTLPASWEACMQNKKQQLEPHKEQPTGPKLGKEYVKAVYCHSIYLTSMQSTSYKMPGWMNHKLESRLQAEIVQLQICR